MTDVFSIIENEKPIGLLSALILSENIPHALLFTGKKGVGKKDGAYYFAQALNCEHKTVSDMGGKPGWGGESRSAAAVWEKRINPCGSCRHCRKIAAGNHPDVLYREPTGTKINPYIGIEAVRELISTFSMRPFEAPFRVAIIHEADKMNAEAANSLLKLLEEPPDKSILVLTANDSADLLPTILSRCQTIRFNPLSIDAIKSYLINEKRMDPRDAEIPSRLAFGSISRALQLSEEEVSDRRNILLKELGDLPEGGVVSALRFAEKLALDKIHLDENFFLMELWFRDAVMAKHTDMALIQSDFEVLIRKKTQKIFLEGLVSAFEQVALTRKRIKQNANLRLNIEILMIGIQKALNL